MLNTIAYEHLRGMIYSSELEFDKIYSETKLAAQLNISRTPIRDALNRLAQERFIEILPNRGFRLHKPTQADIFEAYHVRLMIEGYCAEIVANHYPDAKSRSAIGGMEDALTRQQQLMEADSAYDVSQFWLDDLTFHRSLLEYLNISSLDMHYDSFMHIFMPQHLLDAGKTEGNTDELIERHRGTLREHAEITEALKSHDLQRVKRAIQIHIDSSLRVLYAHMEEKRHDKAD